VVIYLPASRRVASKLDDRSKGKGSLSVQVTFCAWSEPSLKIKAYDKALADADEEMAE
jgi:hypothetical protein